MATKTETLSKKRQGMETGTRTADLSVATRKPESVEDDSKITNRKLKQKSHLREEDKGPMGLPHP